MPNKPPRNGSPCKSSDVLATRASLLGRLRNASDNRAWEDFYKQYRAVILSFARRRGVDEDGAQDVLQETSCCVLRQMPTFNYNPEAGKFRNWLLTIVANKSREALRRGKRSLQISLNDSSRGEPRRLEERLQASRDGPSEETERAWRHCVLEEALSKVLNDPKTDARTAQIYRAYKIEEKSIEEIEQVYQIKANAIYQIANRIGRRLEKEVRALERFNEVDPKF
jgi:RNA polymerase sigma factor (sigma-70 family)